MSKKKRPKPSRLTGIETLEARQVMSADPLGGLLGGELVPHDLIEEAPPLVQHEAPPSLVHHDQPSDEFQLIHHEAPPSLIHHDQQDGTFQLDPNEGYFANDPFYDVEQTLNSAHGLTGLDTVRANYGFTGIGQTVAVIDSGIAYDHYALGGGFGSNYRVVGGWDFTEGDADPYDDGPDGSHGSHVSGIIGGTGDTNGNDVGVAPGVDLVGLRVFNDAGTGSFTWVENALQWVIANRTAFANPITAVNLSLGTTWNSDAPPAWAMLEDEFAQLEADGVFIAVSAGNSFTSYNQPGLSYPAASPYVVPVMSVDDSGSLSYFSQRHSRAIAAPGRFIRSTIPDYAGNNNGITDDWASFSGTSMASPYVAGSSVLVREAMELVGYTNITQDMIYDHMVATADSFFDSATSQSYNRLNLEAAMDALLPSDDYGSTAGAAHSLGNLSANAQISGMVSTLSDFDYFTFTAGVTGTVTIDAQTTNHLNADWDFGSHSVTQSGGDWVMDVVSGQTYTFGLSTSDGLGYYDLDLTAESSFAYVDWGTVTGQQLHNNFANSSDTWYRVAAGQSGYVTAEAFFSAGQGDIDVAFFDANQTLLAGSSQVAGGERIDYIASPGEELFLRVSGTNSDIDFRITNQVAIAGTTLSVTGTSADDTISFVAGTNYDVTVNGVDYSFASGAIDTIAIDAGGGSDIVNLAGSSASETVRMYLAQTTVTGGGYDLTATGFDDVVMQSGGGSNDRALLYDTSGNEQFTAWSDRATLTGTGFSREVVGFDNVTAYSTAGNDTATFHDTAGNDVYVAFSDRALMYGTGYFNDARGFGTTVANATTGFDKAIFHDDAGDETYTAESLHSIRTGNGFSNEAIGFNYSIAYSGLGNDIAILNDSAAYDIFSMLSPDHSIMYSGSTYYNDVRGFGDIAANSTDGIDRAVFRGDSGDQTFTTWYDHTSFISTGLDVTSNGFSYRVAFAEGGNDTATFNDSAGDDTYVGFYNRAVMYGTGYYSDAYGFQTTHAYSTSGDDQAIFHDSPGDDVYSASGTLASMTGATYSNLAHDFGRTIAYSSTGNDIAYYYDTASYDIYVGWFDRSLMYGDGYYNDTRGFDRVEVTATTGNDLAVFYTGTGNEEVHAEAWGAYAAGTNYHNEVRGFSKVNAFDMDGDGGNDEAFTEATDYIFNLYGDWA